jgi:hypothetical protein
VICAISRAVEESNRRMLRARDAIDRAYAQPLDVPALARISLTSEALQPHAPRARHEGSDRRLDRLHDRRLPQGLRRAGARGVEFTEEPTERFYGIDCALRDPFGNAIRITQRTAQPAA